MHLFELAFHITWLATGGQRTEREVLGRLPLAASPRKEE